MQNKFTTVAKNFFSIDQPMNLLLMLQLFALTRPSSFQLKWQPLYPQWVLSFAGGWQRKSQCMKTVRIRSFSGPYFPAFGLRTERYRVSIRIQSGCGKIQTRKSPNMDTFYAVFLLVVKQWVPLWDIHTKSRVLATITIFRVIISIDLITTLGSVDWILWNYNTNSNNNSM